LPRPDPVRTTSMIMADCIKEEYPILHAGTTLGAGSNVLRILKIAGTPLAGLSWAT
jgi:hypothetical protein